MWGNKLGWGISGAMVILFVGAVVLLNLSLSISPPTGKTNALSVELPISPAGIVSAGTEPGDAGELYLRAIDDYRSNYFAYDQFLGDSGATVAQGMKLPAVQWLLDARDKAECSIFKAKPELVVTYEPSKAVDALRVYGNVLTRLGLLTGASGKTPDAIKFHEAAFVLGRWMSAERVVYAEYSAGTGMMGTAAAGLARIYLKQKDNVTVAKFEDFNNARVDFEKNTIAPVWRVLSSIDPNVIKNYPGDIFVIARTSSEPMWRTEAVLKLGRMKYFAGRKGDQVGANRTVRALADTDADPVVRRAAALARDLTIEQYRQIR